jgi:hypothetical protein
MGVGNSIDLFDPARNDNEDLAISPCRFSPLWHDFVALAHQSAPLPDTNTASLTLPPALAGEKMAQPSKAGAKCHPK